MNGQSKDNRNPADLGSINRIIRLSAMFLLVAASVYVYYRSDDNSTNSGGMPFASANKSRTNKSDNAEKAAAERLDNIDPKTHFSQLFMIYNVQPFDASIYDIEGIRYQLDILKRERCSRYALYKISQKLSQNNFNKEAIEFIKGYSSICPDSDGDLLHAANLAYSMGNYQDALELSNEVIHKNPSANLAIYQKALALHKLDRHADALSAYIDVIKSMPDQKLIKPMVFSDLASSYASLGKYCEAASAIQTYVAFDYDNRMNNAYKEEIENYEKRGDCMSGYSSGSPETFYQKHGSIIAAVVINGVKGNFIIDTGASLVSVTPSFAIKAKLLKMRGDIVQTSTANGAANALLVSFNDVAVGRLHAKKVPALIMDKNLNNGLDGLLGLSFLSRFNLSTEGKKMTITPTKDANSTNVTPTL